MKSKLFLILFFTTISIVAQDNNFTTPKPIISLKNRNVLYRGVDNKIEIVVPGAKLFNVSAPGLRVNGNETYSWNVTQIETNTASIDFEIMTNKDSLFTITDIFYVKNIKPLRATINERGCENCIIELSREDVKDAKIGVGFEDLIDLDLQHFNVKGFFLELPDGNLYRVGEDKFSDSAQKMILQFSNGDIFKISEIEFSHHGYITQRPKMKFMLVNKYD